MADITQVAVQCLLNANDYEYMNGLANLAVANQALDSSRVVFYMLGGLSLTMTMVLSGYVYVGAGYFSEGRRLNIKRLLRDRFGVSIWILAITTALLMWREGGIINDKEVVVQKQEAVVSALTLPDPQITASCGFKVAGNDDIQMVSIDLAEDGQPSTINYEYTNSK